MAFAPLLPGNPLLDVIPQLDLSQVPDKLHCATCNHFLLNAFKAACCDATICATCNEKATDACPVCNHAPFISNPSKAMRGTARAFLKTTESRLQSSKVTSEAPVLTASTISASATHYGDNTRENKSSRLGESEATTARIPLAAKTSNPNGSNTESAEPAGIPGVVASIEVPHPTQVRLANSVDADVDADVDVNDNDDDIEIRVEGPLDSVNGDRPQGLNPDEEEETFGMSEQIENRSAKMDEERNDTGGGMGTSSYDRIANINQGFGNMQQMLNNMQQMSQMMGMNNGSFNPMMMMNMMNGFNNPMTGAFGGPQGGANGMNPMDMGMNFYNQDTGSYGSNSQMWNNGYDGNNFMSQQRGLQQQYPNGDSSGYYNGTGRFGRGGKRRGGGGWNRGRGAFHQFPQGYGAFPNASGHQQQHSERNQNFVAPESHISMAPMPDANKKDQGSDENVDDDEFAPGGQDEVQEALGEQYGKSQVEEVEILPTPESTSESTLEVTENTPQNQVNEDNSRDEIVSELVALPAAEIDVTDENIPEAYKEDLETIMAPPTAPLGPASKDFGFRARGHGRYSSRGGSGSFSTRNGLHVPQIQRSSSQTQSFTQPVNNGVGLGVVGAPTGPRAMRERERDREPQREPQRELLRELPRDSQPERESSAPVQTVPRSNPDAGFKIVGRASMKSREIQPTESKTSSVTARSTHEEFDEREKHSSRKRSRIDDQYGDSRYDETEEIPEKSSDYKRRKSRRDDHDKYEERDDAAARSRSASPDRKSSYRSSRKDREREKEKHSSSTKYKSSSRRHDTVENGDHELDGYGDVIEPSIHRSSRKSSNKYEVRDHELERDRDRERDRERERDRDQDRERERDRVKARDRDHERSDKHRKRSRHERDRDDEQDGAEDEARHRSRKHRREHRSSRKDNDRDVDDPDLGMRISGRSAALRNSEKPAPAGLSTGTEKDPHTLEREARNQERMVKEQQRREKAAQDRLTGGRRVSYKYEDEIERSLGKPSRRR